MLARNARLAAIRDRIDSGSGPGVLRVYTGSRPATPETAPSGTLLAEFTLADPSFATPASAAMDLDADPDLETVGIAPGTAGWGRLLTSTEAAGTGLGESDGTVGVEFTMSTTTVSVGLPLRVTLGSITEPLG